MPDAKPTTGRTPQVAEVPDANETVRGADDPAVVTLQLGPKLHERRLLSTDELPGSIIIPTTNFTAVPVTAALQAVLDGTDVSLSWDNSAFENHLVTVTNLSGSLPSVVNKICASAKIFCNFRHGMLELKEKETFVVDLPALPTKSGTTATSGGSETANNTMAAAIEELAGDKVKVDQQGGNLIYTTDVDGQDRIREYLEKLRHGMPLIVMQLYIWEVTLNKENGTGINWSKFKIPRIGGGIENLLLANPVAAGAAVGTGFTQFKTPGVSLGATMSGKIDADAVIQFLSTKGQVQTISNPQLTFISGANAEFKVGGKQRYISQVGQLTTSNVSGSNTTNTGIGTNTVSTDSIDTGLTVDMGGSYENGVIFAMLELSTQDVVDLNPQTSQGVTIDLPITSERKVSTTLRVRPGDNLVLAGLVTSRDTNKREGIPMPFGGNIPAYADDQMQNTELVILVKPSVVLFADSSAEDKVREQQKNDVGVRQPLDAVIIDKDGARIMKMPEAPSQPIDLQPSAFPTTPAPAQQGPVSMPTGNVPPAQDNETAPVDKRLLQRGFSHAFDELLTSPSILDGGKS